MTKQAFLTKFLIFFAGFYIGVNLTSLFRNGVLYSYKQCLFAGPSGNVATNTRRSTINKPRKLCKELHTKQLVFVGVMTSGKFVGSRAVAVYNTWGTSVPGKIVFFSGNETRPDVGDLPLVRLDGVDDSYPPQRKSFMMLKYMHDHYIDQFEYFMRSDDDLYMRTEKLEEFLRSLDSSKDLFIGQGGVGSRNELGRLGLGPTGNFCMGGTGTIMTRSVLRKLAPHLEYCLQNIVSGHEDVELGRCVKKHVGVDCTWAFEMQWLFYHNHSKGNSFHWDLNTKSVQNSITLHPIKIPKYMYRLHSFFLEKKLQAVQHKSVTMSTLLWRLTEELKKQRMAVGHIKTFKEKKDLYLNAPSNSTLHWELFNAKLFYTTITRPDEQLTDQTKKGLNNILRNTLFTINAEIRKVIFRELTLSKVNLGYLRVYPTQGAQYLLDLRMHKYQHLGYSRRKLPLNIHYQAHMQQPFGNLVYTSATVLKTKSKINIIMPLAGRLHAFATFLSNFERVVLANNENVKLLIMYFPDVSSYINHHKILNMYQDHYPSLNVKWMEIAGTFSRSKALQTGSDYFGSDSLLFFCDVDLEFDLEFLQRCRQHASLGKQVYFPMVFSQFNQTLGNINSSNSPLHKERGFWRKYGFGIACVYSGDIKQVGGLDTHIQGWGLEDVILYEKFVSSGRFTVFRSPDPGLIHIYHSSKCSLDLEPSRFQMCTASKMSQLGSAKSLVYLMESKGYL